MRLTTAGVENTTFWLTPMLSNRRAGAGNSNSIYFLQDLLVSSRILSRPDCRHLDIGSRIDGFVAQIASSMQIDVLDIRPMTLNLSAKLRFVQADILDPPVDLRSQYDLVSSLHAL